MSSLLAGPSSMNPWIEDVCFHALTQRPTPQRPRLAQVLAMRLSLHSSTPPLLVLHDGKTLVVAFIQSSISPSISRGCMVRIADWKVSLVQHHAQDVLDFSNRDMVNSILNANPDQLCFNVGNVQVLGAHGIGIVGNPTPVHQSVEVRRAIMNLTSKGISLQEQLQPSRSSKARLGNVQELFANDENRTMIETLLAVPKHGIGNGKTSATPFTTTTNDMNGTSSGVVLGDVSSLLESMRKDSSESNFVSKIMLMNQSSSRKRVHTADHSTAAEETTRSHTNHPGAVLGNVRHALAAGSDHSMADALYAAANSASTTKRQEQDSTNTTSVANQARDVEPYGIRERFESRTSVVSLLGISHALRSLVSRRESSLDVEPNKNGVEEAKAEEDVGDTAKDKVHGNDKEVSTQTNNETETRDNDSDCESQVLGISDMLISQTQELPEDAIAACENSDKVEAETTPNVTFVSEKVIAGSQVECVETAASSNDSDTPADELSTTNRSNNNDATEAESTLQDAVIEERGAVASSNVYFVETGDKDAVNQEAAVETRVIEATSAKRNIDHDEALVEQSLETKSYKKRPFEHSQDEENVEESIANEYATQPETQPPLQPSDEDGIEAKGVNNERKHGDTTSVARLPVPKKALASTNSKRPKKKRRKGMLNLWKEIAQRKEKQQSDT